MEQRLSYIKELADFTGQSEKTFLKKEARIFLDETLLKMEIFHQSEEKIKFSSQVNIFTNEKTKNRNGIFEYTFKHCHVYFNTLLGYENNLYAIFKYEFKLSAGDSDTILRQCFKSFLKSHNIEPHKKIKFFLKGI